MNSNDLNLLHEFMHNREKKLLNQKSVDYATDDNRLINFYETAELMQTTTAKACWNLMTKHLQSIRLHLDDAHMTDDFIQEKIGDIRNYLVLLTAILYERNNISVADKFK